MPDTVSPPLVVMAEQWPTGQGEATIVTLTEALETAAALSPSSEGTAAVTQGQWAMGVMQLDSNNDNENFNIFSWLKTTSGPFHFEIDSVYVTRLA